MFKKVFGLALVLVALSLPALAQEKIYINGIDANFPPFAYVENGQPAGFDVDAMNWIAKEMGFKVVHQPMEWSTIVASLANKKIDLIASGLSYTEERAQQIAFSDPYWVIKQVVIVQKDSTLTAEDILTGGDYKIGVQSGTSDAEAMKEMNGQDGYQYTLIDNYQTSTLAAQDVVNGRLDAAVMNDAPAADAASKIPVKIVGSAGIPDETFAVGLNREDAELLNIINEGLKKLMSDPYWDELIAKYNPGGIEE